MMFRIRKASKPVDLDATLGPPLRLTDIEQSEAQHKEEPSHCNNNKENIDSKTTHRSKATPLALQPKPTTPQLIKKPEQPIRSQTTRVNHHKLDQPTSLQCYPAVTHPTTTPTRSTTQLYVSRDDSTLKQQPANNHQLLPRKPVTINSNTVSNNSATVANNSNSVIQPIAPIADAMKHTIIIDRKQYCKLSVIGQGGSSQVFKVLSEENNKLFALKEVYMKTSPAEIKQAYVNEIRLLKKLKGHPQIVTLYGCSWDPREGVLRILLEHGEMDLRELIHSKRDSRQPIRDNPLMLMFLWQQMLSSVKVIHDEGIIHNDLKPENFICSGFQLKLIDFGIANKIEEEHTSIERDMRCGTVSYMAPECIMTHDTSDYFKIGRSSDVWSLGCILYQMIFHSTPFDHIKGKIQKFHAITNPMFTITIPEPIDKHAKDIIEKCLQRDPKSRPTIEQLLKHEFISHYTI